MSVRRCGARLLRRDRRHRRAAAADRARAARCCFTRARSLDPIHLGSAPTWRDLIFALTIATIAFTGLESAAGLAGETRVDRARAASGSSARASATIVLVYVGIAIVGVSALPVGGGPDAFDRPRHRGAAAVGRRRVHPHWLAGTLRYVVAVLGRRRRSWRRPTRRCSASRGSPTRSRPTARSPARSAACTRGAGRRTC